MRPILAPLAVATLAGAALALGCSQPPASLPSDLKDPEALVVNETTALLFIASTGTDELRVLELNPNVDVETYVDAPNPLYVLSIPVVSRPFAMVADTDGMNPGTFLFVLSASENRLGIVNSNPDAGLVELQEVALPGTPLALAARTNADGSARVFIGMSTGTHGSVAVVDVPVVGALPAPGLPVNSAYADLETAEPASLVISPDGNTLAIGDRLADEANPNPALRRGGVIFLDISDRAGTQAGSLSRINVGGPVRKLVFNPGSTGYLDGGGGDIPAGKFMYVVLDNSGCELGKPCGGVQVVIDGQVPETTPGVPWEPMRVPGEATDVSVGQGPFFNLPPQAGMGGAIRVPLLLAIPATDGHIYFGDGVEGTLYNVDFQQPSVTTSIVHLDPGGNLITLADAGYDLSGPTDVELSQGAIQSGAVTITFLGALPVLAHRAGLATGNTLTDTAAIFADLGVELGDAVAFTSSDPTCSGSQVLVAAIGSYDGGLGPTQLGLNASVPASCAADPDLRYTIIAGVSSADQYVVVGGTVESIVPVPDGGLIPNIVIGAVPALLGRTRPNSDFRSAPNYFYRPIGFDPMAPGIAFHMGSGATPLAAGSGPPPGESWTFNVDSAVLPMQILGGIDGLIPSVAAWDTGLSSFFVAYPGSDVTSEVVQFDPASITYDTDGNITEWE